MYIRYSSKLSIDDCDLSLNYTLTQLHYLPHSSLM